MPDPLDPRPSADGANGEPMRLAIADPPYLGRAALWYGGKGRSKTGRGCLAPEFHPDAHEWDDPVKHIELMVALEDEFDGWAVACSGKTLAPLIGTADRLGARLAIWHVTNAIPDGARVRSVWEGVFYRVPDSRRAVGTGRRVTDILSAGHPMNGFVGSKPTAWTHWVLDMLGYVPGEDEVVDLFAGSGAVSRVTDGMLL